MRTLGHNCHNFKEVFRSTLDAKDGVRRVPVGTAAKEQWPEGYDYAQSQNDCIAAKGLDTSNPGVAVITRRNCVARLHSSAGVDQDEAMANSAKQQPAGVEDAQHVVRVRPGERIEPFPPELLGTKCKAGGMQFIATNSNPQKSVRIAGLLNDIVQTLHDAPPAGACC